MDLVAPGQLPWIPHASAAGNMPTRLAAPPAAGSQIALPVVPVNATQLPAATPDASSQMISPVVHATATRRPGSAECQGDAVHEDAPVRVNVPVASADRPLERQADATQTVVDANATRWAGPAENM